MKTTLRSTLFILLLAFVMVGALPLIAQEALTNTYDANGVTFDYPDGWQVMEQEGMVAIMGTDTMGIIVPPAMLEMMGLELEGDLSESIATVFETLNQEPELGFDASALTTLDLNGREAVRFDFSDNGTAAALIMLRMSDGSVGVFAIAAMAESLTPEQDALLLAMAATLDVGETSAASANAGYEPMFTFPNGVGFDYPESWTLDESTISDSFVMVMGPSMMAYLQVFELQSLYGEMSPSLDMLKDQYGGSYADSFDFEYAAENYEAVDFDGREAVVYRFEGTNNDTPMSGVFVITSYSNGGKGVVMAYTVSTPPENFDADVLAVAKSLDFYGEVEEVAPNPEDATVIAEPVVAAEGESFAFPSGATFNYPDTWVLDESTISDNFVMLTGPQVSFLQVFDLKALFGGMDLGMETIMNQYGTSYADSFDFDFHMDNYAKLDFDGREAAAYSFTGKENSGTFVITTYSGGGQGLVMAYTVGEAPESLEADVLAIAASFDGG